MAFRGGGRGRGRGRGRGFPVVRDEDGAAVITKNGDGPPLLFPPLDLPVLPILSQKDEQLVSRRRHLESAWNVSPYFIEKPRPKPVGVAEEIDRYSDRYKFNVQTKRLPLESVLKLAPAYFPAGLLGKGIGNQGRSNKSSGEQWILQAGAGKFDLKRLDRLETREQKESKDTDDKDEEEKKKKEGEDGDEDNEDGILEDEEEEFGDEDYAQNFGFDDDDDYVDMDDGGGDDDGATY